MSDIRLYVDENAEQRVLVDGLRDRNVDVVTAMEADMLAVAIAHNWITRSNMRARSKV